MKIEGGITENGPWRERVLESCVCFRLYEL